MEETKKYQVVDSVEKLEDTIARVRAAQKKFAEYTQEQVDEIFFAAATAANQQRIPLAKWQLQKREWAWLKTRSSKTIMPPSTSTTRTATPRPAESSKRTSPSASKNRRAYRRNRRGYSYHQPDFHRDFQDAHRPENQKRYHHQSSPQSQELHHRRRQNRSRSGSQSGCSRRHYRLD